MKKYARKCDITGEGMNEGYVYMESTHIKYKKDLIAKIRAGGDKTFNDASDEFIYDEAYNLEEFYWTQWEDVDDYEYIEIDGKLIDIDEWDGEEEKDLTAQIIEAAKNLVKKAESNCVDLWKADLSESVSCYTHYPESIPVDSEGDKTIQTTGIHVELINLENLLKRMEEES